MKTYKVTRESASHNPIVKALNANVCPLTFATTTGTQEADLYHSPNECPTLVGCGACAPVNAEYIETVLIEF